MYTMWFCCHRRVCFATPDEMDEIVKFLGLTFEKFWKEYLTIDKKDAIYFLKFVSINTKEYAGDYLPDEETYNEGDCIFLDENRKCKIYPVRPFTSKLFECWTDNINDNADATEKAWQSWGETILKERYNIDIDNYL